MFTHTLYLSISIQSRYFFTHKRPLYLSTVYTHSPNLSLSLSLSLFLTLYTHVCYYCTVHILSIYLHTLPLSVHTTSLSLSIDLSTHNPSLYLSTRSLSLSVHTRTHTHTHCLSVCLQHFTFFNLALEYFFLLFTVLIILILLEDWMPLA